VDSDLVTHPPSSRAIALPFTTTAKDKLGNDMVANVIALGAIAELTGLVTRRALEKALLNRGPASSEDINKKALRVGIKLAHRHTQEEPPEELPGPETEDI
jgi:2-oxoglutarate ferredoxin oxidoreductase subunit gamma